MSMFLTEQEVADLTGKKRRPSQVEALRRMGLEHIVRPDGVVMVLRSYIEVMLGATNQARSNVKKEVEPDWSVLNG